jgi:hypothetical protein
VRRRRTLTLAGRDTTVSASTPGSRGYVRTHEARPAKGQARRSNDKRTASQGRWHLRQPDPRPRDTRPVRPREGSPSGEGVGRGGGLVDPNGGVRRAGAAIADDRPMPQWRLGDLPMVLELKLQFFNYLGQRLSRKGVCGLQGEPAGLLQLSFQCYAPHACHLGAPIYREFSKMCTDTLTIR